MRTYLTIMFDSEGASPSEIKNQLFNLGFEATQGNYDFVYNWNKESLNVDELVWFADKVHTALKNSKVHFTIETR